LKDRRILRDEGFISVVVVVDSVTGKVAGGPEIHARGFADQDSVFDPLRRIIEEALEKAAGPGVRAAKDFAPHHPNRRILPSQFVVAAPALDSGIALVSNPYNVHAPSTPVWRIAGAPVPSRAPPALG